jgi:hypothetical protein
MTRDVAFRSLLVLGRRRFIALIAGIYEVDRREKSTSDTIAANLRELGQRVELLGDQVRILSSQLMSQLNASERQVQVLGNQMQALELRLKQLEGQRPPPR